REIKFTDKSIYDYMVEQVGNDKDYIVLNYFENRISYADFFQKIKVFLVGNFEKRLFPSSCAIKCGVGYASSELYKHHSGYRK
ncbi:MAG: hypothetical protein J6V76_01375, partial [Bacteroidales bacterium]|nr:hypothetical protein [Bacteroidales bacterium]